MFDGLVRHLASHGERVAVLTDEGTLTYRELADESRLGRSRTRHPDAGWCSSRPATN